MKILGVICGLISLACAQTSHAEKTTPKYTSTVVFGDSLVDAGNAQALFGPILGVDFAAQGYFEGRFTNGYDYTDLVSIGLTGSATRASLLGGSNYAWGGARIIGGGLPSLSQQIDSYASSLGSGQADPNALFMLTAGANDVFASNVGDYAGFGSSTEYLNAAMDQYAAGVKRLNDLGARNILVTNVLNGNDELDRYLSNSIGSLALDARTTVFEGDLRGIGGNALFNPSAYGLPAWNFSQSCRDARAWPSCAGYFFFDETHPTAAVQNIIFDELNSRFSLTAAVPEPATWLTMVMGFGLMGFAMRRRRTVGYGPSTSLARAPLQRNRISRA